MMRVHWHIRRYTREDLAEVRRPLVVAKGVHEATDIARRLAPVALFEDGGAPVLAWARALGIRDNEAGFDDGPAP